MSEPPPGTVITAQRVLMTPEWAKELEATTINRDMNPDMVELLTGEIKGGHWVEDGNPIRVDWNGNVRDGQNRLRAIQNAGVAVYVILVEGLAPESQLTMDTGTRRRFAHWLRIQGRTDVQNKAAITVLLYNYQRGVLTTRTSWQSRKGVPHLKLWEFFLQHEDEINASITVARHARREISCSVSVFAAGWLILSGIDWEDATGFYAEIALDTPQKPHGGPHLLYRYMKNNKKGFLDQQEQLAILFKAWLLYRDGGTAQYLYWRHGGEAKELFPIPV